MKTIQVDLGTRSYPIVVGGGILPQTAHWATQKSPPSSAVIVTHPHLVKKYAAPVEQSYRSAGIPVHILTIPPGERYKTLASAGRIHEELAALRIDRKAQLVAVGGGVLGDLVGFVAATWLRGVHFVQVPTTLLAQVDASVGGKTAVDLPAGKNLVGAFHQPLAVVVDTDTLSTLPHRELRSGLAEVVKYGIIFDAEFHRQIASSSSLLLKRDPDSLHHAIVRSCEIKAHVVSEDETETGLRAILNFGHTVGHALETITAYRRYKHGEAIAIGMVTACLVGEELGVTDSGTTTEVESALRRFRLLTAYPDDISAEAVVEAAKGDKKSISGGLRFVLAESIGNVGLPLAVEETAVLAAIHRHRERTSE